jgi:cell division protein FtsQ
MKLAIKLVLFFILTPIAIGGMLFQLDKHGFFDLERIDIILVDVDQKPLYLKPLIEKLDQSLEVYRGQSLWSLGVGDISRKVGGLSWVQEHSVSRSWPSRLNVKIRAHEVRALLLTENEQLHPVISGGEILGPVQSGAAPDVIILEGANFAQKNDLRQKALELLKELPKEGVFSTKTLSEIRWDQRQGFVARMTKTGLEINLGDDNFAIKSARLSQVINYLNNRGIQPKAIDANLSKKVLVRLPTLSSDGPQVIEIQ